MLEPGGETVSLGFVNAVVLALWPVFPILVFSYCRQSWVARRIRAEFSLRKSESIELDRAELLHDKVCRRLKELRDPEKHPAGWRDLFNRRRDTPQQHADELEDLEAHVQHLRTTIMQLRSRPLQRLRYWLRIRSSQFALGRALAAHVMGFTLLLIMAFHIFEQSAWANESTSGASNVLFWYPFDARLFYANAVGAGFAVVVAPVFYLTRWVSLRREYSLEFCLFKGWARTEPVQSIDQPHAEEAAQHQPRQADPSEACGDCNWITIFGLSETATIEDVRKAYKALIKQNHPDRVYEMSPAFRKLAESETKKINEAYRQALMSLASV